MVMAEADSAAILLECGVRAAREVVPFDRDRAIPLGREHNVGALARRQQQALLRVGIGILMMPVVMI